LVTFTLSIIKLYENFFKLLIIEKILQIYDIALKMEKKGEDRSPFIGHSSSPSTSSSLKTPF